MSTFIEFIPIAYRNSILNRVLHNPFGPVCIRRLIISSQTLLCPDLMYSTARGSVPTIPESDWRLMARKHKLLGVVTGVQFNRHLRTALTSAFTLTLTNNQKT